jgi:hypothetical protein
MPESKRKISLEAKRTVKQLKKGLGFTYQVKGKPETEKPPTPASPYLVIKNNPNDTGDRPLENPNYYPDSIWIEEFTASGGEGDRVITPQEGGRYRVCVEIHNLGSVASYATFVEFYCYLYSPSDPAESRTYPIGVPKMITINAGCSSVQRSDLWIPEVLGGGHDCIIVRAYDPIMDPMDLSIYSLIVDRHVGQRNIAIAMAPPGTNVFLSFSTWSAQTNEELSLSVHTIDKNDLARLVGNIGLKGAVAKSSLVYSGLMTKESLMNAYRMIPELKLKEHLRAFEVPSKKQQKRIEPLPREVDSRYASAVLPTLRKKTAKSQIDQTWLVHGVPQKALKGEIYGATVAQWRGRELIGKVHQIVIVT